MFIDSQIVLQDYITYPKPFVDLSNNYIRDMEDTLLRDKPLFLYLFTACEIFLQFPFFFVATFAIYYSK